MGTSGTASLDALGAGRPADACACAATRSKKACADCGPALGGCIVSKLGEQRAWGGAVAADELRDAQKNNQGRLSAVQLSACWAAGRGACLAASFRRQCTSQRQIRTPANADQHPNHPRAGRDSMASMTAAPPLQQFSSAAAAATGVPPQLMLACHRVEDPTAKESRPTDSFHVRGRPATHQPASQQKLAPTATAADAARSTRRRRAAALWLRFAAQVPFSMILLLDMVKRKATPPHSKCRMVRAVQRGEHTNACGWLAGLCDGCAYGAHATATHAFACVAACLCCHLMQRTLPPCLCRLQSGGAERRARFHQHLGHQRRRRARAVAE